MKWNSFSTDNLTDFTHFNSFCVANQNCAASVPFEMLPAGHNLYHVLAPTIARSIFFLQS